MTNKDKKISRSVPFSEEAEMEGVDVNEHNEQGYSF